MYRPKQLIEKVQAHGLAAGSALGQLVPPLGRRFTGLTGPQDRLLRWRVAQGQADPEGWLEMYGPEGSSVLNEPQLVVIAARKRYMDQRTEEGYRPAVAIWVGDTMLAGTGDLRPRDDFLRPVDAVGAYDSEGEWLGVVVRNGEQLNRIALGGMARDNFMFFPMATHRLATVGAVPEGLLRV